MSKFLLIFFSSIILSGCFHTPQSEDSSDSTSNLSSLTDPRQIIEKFASVFSGVDHYTAVITSQTEENTQSIITIKYYQGNTHTTFSTAEGENQVISTPDATFMKSPQADKWLKFPQDTQTDLSDAQFDLESFQIDLEAEEIAPEYLGTAPCGDLTCHVYQTILEDTTSKIMFDTQDFLLRRVEISGLETASMDYSYDPVTITVPPDSEVTTLPSDPSQINLEELNSIIGQ